jgi:PAS domain-containing protein
MGRAFFDQEGRPVRFLGTTLDITERRRAEAKLRESEERFRRVFEEGPLGVALVNRNYRFQPWDGNLDSLTDEQLEKLLAQFRAMLQASEQAHSAAVRQITAGETVIDISAENAGAADGNNWEQNAR